MAAHETDEIISAVLPEESYWMVCLRCSQQKGIRYALSIVLGLGDSLQDLYYRISPHKP